jgi:hypothetical protein
MKKCATGGMMKKMAGGGMSMVMKDGKEVPSFAADGKGKMAKGGAAMKKMASGGMMKKCATGGMSKDLAEHAGKPASKAHAGLKAGGFVRAADGAAKKGKTKGKVL